MNRCAELAKKVKAALRCSRRALRMSGQYGVGSQLNLLIAKLKEFQRLIRVGEVENVSLRLSGITRFILDWVPSEWRELVYSIAELEKTANEILGVGKVYPNIEQDRERRLYEEVKQELGKLVSSYITQPKLIGEPSLVDRLIMFWDAADISKKEVIIKEIISWLVCDINERVNDALEFFERISLRKYPELASYTLDELTRIKEKWTLRATKTSIDYREKIARIRGIIGKLYGL